MSFLGHFFSAGRDTGRIVSYRLEHRYDVIQSGQPWKIMTYHRIGYTVSESLDAVSRNYVQEIHAQGSSKLRNAMPITST